MSTDADKIHDNVIIMPDIYAEDLAIVDVAANEVEMPDLDPDESAGFDPYDTARLYKEKLSPKSVKD